MNQINMMTDSTVRADLKQNSAKLRYLKSASCQVPTVGSQDMYCLMRLTIPVLSEVTMVNVKKMCH